MVPLDPSINVGILHSTTSYQSSDRQCEAMEASLTSSRAIFCHDAGLSSGDDGEDISPSPPEWPPPQLDPPQEAQEQQPFVFDLQGPVDEAHGQVDVEEEDLTDKPVAAKMLHEHHCMAHLPFSRMRAMARAGLLPHVFATCHKPLPSAMTETCRTQSTRFVNSFSPTQTINTKNADQYPRTSDVRKKHYTKQRERLIIYKNNIWTRSSMKHWPQTKRKNPNNSTT